LLLWVLRIVRERSNMRRLCILLAAALMATTLVALTMSTAGAQSPAKRYAAIAVNEYTNKHYAYKAPSKWRATHWALMGCQRDSGKALDQYCEGTGWVRDGWIVLFYEEHYQGTEKKKNHWGFGWAANHPDAYDNAKYWCEKAAKYPCYKQISVESSRVQGAASGGSW
jgi:hypothetical protein